MIISKENALYLLEHALGHISRIDPSRIEYSDDAVGQKMYELRNELVHDCVFYARRAGLKSGYIIHDPIIDLLPRQIELDMKMYDANPVWDKQWGVVAVIELPQGQISWHMDSKDLEWDGHTDDIKWDRVEEFIK